MAAKPTDYSKWERLEISDDEAECPPNIDMSLFRRINREKRAERKFKEEEEDKKLLAEGTPEALAKLEELRNSRPLCVDDCYVTDSRSIINSSDGVKDTRPVVQHKPTDKVETEQVV